MKVLGAYTEMDDRTGMGNIVETITLAHADNVMQLSRQHALLEAESTQPRLH